MPDYRQKSQKATAYLRKYLFVGVGPTDAKAQAMWQKLAKESEAKFSTKSADAKLARARVVEKVVGPDDPATDYPATDYPATDYVAGDIPGSAPSGTDAAAPPPGGLSFYTAIAVYDMKKKKPKAGAAATKRKPAKR